MSLRRNPPPPQLQQPLDHSAVYAHHAQQQQLVPYETNSGFALTSSGAIGFAPEIENKLALASAITQAAAAAPPAPAPAAAAASEQPQQQQGGVQSNREAFARMQITCESIVNQDKRPEPLQSRREVSSNNDSFQDAEEDGEFDSHHREQEMHRLASMFENSSQYGIKTGLDALSRVAFEIHHNKDDFNADHLKKAKALARQWQIYRIFRQKLNQINETAGMSNRKGGLGLPNSVNVFRANARVQMITEIPRDIKDNLNLLVKKLTDLWNDFMSLMPDTEKKYAQLNPRLNFWKVVENMIKRNWAGPETRKAERAKRILEEIYKVYAKAIKLIEDKMLPHGMPHREEVPEFFTDEVKDKLKSYKQKYRAEKKERKNREEKKEEGKLNADAQHPSVNIHIHNGQVPPGTMPEKVQSTSSQKKATASIPDKSVQKENKAPNPKGSQGATNSAAMTKQAGGTSMPKQPSAAPPAPRPSRQQKMQVIPVPVPEPKKAAFNTGEHDFCTCEQSIPVPTTHDFCTCEQPIPVPITHAGYAPAAFSGQGANRKARRAAAKMRMAPVVPMLPGAAPATAAPAVWQPVMAPPTGAAPLYGYAPMTAAPYPAYGYAPVYQ